MKIGIGSYTYVWSVGVAGYAAPAHPMTADRLLDRAVALGAGVVQIADNLPLDERTAPELDALAGRARELGIGLEVGTRGIGAQTLAAYLDIARRLGSPIVRTLLDSPGHEPTPAEAVAMLRAAAPAYERAGVTIAIENHDRFKAVTLRRIVEQAGSPAVGVCLDTANSLGCGEGIEQVLETLAHLVVNLHVKDFTVRRLGHNKGFVVEGAPAGRGMVDIPATIDRLRKAGRDVNAIVELWPAPESSVEASCAKEEEWAEESVRYLRSIVEAASAGTASV